MERGESRKARKTASCASGQSGNKYTRTCAGRRRIAVETQEMSRGSGALKTHYVTRVIVAGDNLYEHTVLTDKLSPFGVLAM